MTDALARGSQFLALGDQLAATGDYVNAIRKYVRSWDNVQDAISLANQNPPVKELVKAENLLEQAMDPQYWLDRVAVNVGASGPRHIPRRETARRPWRRWRWRRR